MKLPRTLACLALLVVSAFWSTPLRAEVRLPKVFGDHMVLQRQQPIQLWGWADADEEVTASLAGQTATTKAGADGRWTLKLAPLEAGGPWELKVVGKNTVVLGDILVGEVWLCSGQSNMEFTVKNVDRAEQEQQAANYPAIRMLNVKKHVAEKPVDDIEGVWAVCSPATVFDFSAVGYFFGRKLYQELNVPVGLINSSWGGTECECWASREALQADPDFQPILARSATFQEGKAHQASVLYNGMIHPLIPLGIRGALWYQGESNVGRAVQYQKLFPAMISDWRGRWGEGDFPFLFVELAPFIYKHDPTLLAELWDAQVKTLKLANTGMAVTTDIVGNLKDIHPRNKQDVGQRLAFWALAKTYGRPMAYSGPLYKEMQVEGDAIRVRFDQVGGGLVAKGGPLSYFTIAGEDGKFVPAQAVIDGDAVVVSSAEVKQPKAVRFAWQQDAQPNLFNQAGLPASPFRTDDFPLLTAGKF